MRVNFVTNACGSRFKKVSENEWVVQGVPMTVDNDVMNGVYYPEDENEKGLNSYRGKPVVLRHPEDEQGNPTSAFSGNGMYKHYSGGVITNTYNHNGINYLDAKFNVDTMKAQGGEWYANQIENGNPIGISTGLYFDGNNEEGIAPNGKKYHAVARNQVGDHVAMLPEDEPPAGGEQTFMRFNGENNDQTVVINIDGFIENMEVNEPTKNALDKFKEWCKQTFAPLKLNSDNSQEINNTDEDDAMRETLIAALAAKGITVNAEITDAELLAKYNEANTPDVAAAVNAAIKPLADELAEVKGKLTENADKELDALAEQAAPLLGVEKDEAKSLGANALHKVLAKNGVVVGGAVVSGKPEEETKVGLNAKMPWEE